MNLPSYAGWSLRKRWCRDKLTLWVLLPVSLIFVNDCDWSLLSDNSCADLICFKFELTEDDLIINKVCCCCCCFWANKGAMEDVEDDDERL